MFRKLGKLFLSFTVIGGIFAVAIYFYTNHVSENSSEHNITDESDDFNLDSDLEPMIKREYVPLSRNTSNE